MAKEKRRYYEYALFNSAGRSVTAAKQSKKKVIGAGLWNLSHTIKYTLKKRLIVEYEWESAEDEEDE